MAPAACVSDAAAHVPVQSSTTSCADIDAGSVAYDPWLNARLPAGPLPASQPQGNWDLWVASGTSTSSNVVRDDASNHCLHVAEVCCNEPDCIGVDDPPDDRLHGLPSCSYDDLDDVRRRTDGLNARCVVTSQDADATGEELKKFPDRLATLNARMHSVEAADMEKDGFVVDECCPLGDPDRLPISELVTRYCMQGPPLPEQFGTCRQQGASIIFESDDRMDNFLSDFVLSVLVSKKDLDRAIGLIEYLLGKRGLDQLPHFILKHVTGSPSKDLTHMNWKQMKNVLAGTLRAQSSKDV